MALRSAFGSLFRGEFREAANYMFVPQAEVDRGNELDNRLQQIVADDYAAGTVNAEEMNATLNRIQENAFPYIFQQEGTNPTLGFVEGLNEGREAIKKTFGDVLGFTLKTVPWQIWVIAAIAGLIYLAPVIAPFAKKAFKIR